MKAKIRLLTSYPKTVDGYPVALELTHLKSRKRKIIFHSETHHWNNVENVPAKNHPVYNILISEVLELHSKIAMVNLGKLSFDKASQLLFNDQVIAANFYDAGITLCGDDTNGDLYRTILNSFNAVFPGVAINEITPEMAKKYMQTLLLKNKPNGVHTYMRTLNAIYNKLTDHKNPFVGIRPKKEKTANRGLTDVDVMKLINTRTYVNKFDGRNNVHTVNYDRYYWLLMFYLGGIDMVDLAQLRYDKHVVNGRIEFYRGKGGTNAFVSNKIFDQAFELLKHFDCYPYLVPIYKYKSYKSFVNKFVKRFNENTKDLQLTKKPTVKTTRYTFINRAKDLLIDERITMELVGHEQRHTHSIYTGHFTDAVRDAAHLKIINL